MGHEASVGVGDRVAAVQAPGLPPDLQFVPLPADADPDRAWTEEGLRRAPALARVVRSCGAAGRGVTWPGFAGGMAKNPGRRRNRPTMISHDLHTSRGLGKAADAQRPVPTGGGPEAP